MKCPRCWTEKVHRHTRNDWRAPLLACLSLVPVKCHHCYHKFYASCFRLAGHTQNRPLVRARKAQSA